MFLHYPPYGQYRNTTIVEYRVFYRSTFKCMVNHLPRYINRATTGFSKSGGSRGGTLLDLFGMYQPDHPWFSPYRYTM